MIFFCLCLTILSSMFAEYCSLMCLLYYYVFVFGMRIIISIRILFGSVYLAYGSFLTFVSLHVPLIN